ncbi:MAG: GH64 / CBM32 [uncultured Corynebacteriales bacterium]|uniref:GH64 / CBM32 n=1 Tax=uncultured Mycobacteriales bacterium TaxID=581187 RepID=A0A6J4IBF0_9ACTN|nr:MAG: GH64 / CBM32 [uncultured Corynebacteriales bacterium]
MTYRRTARRTAVPVAVLALLLGLLTVLPGRAAAAGPLISQGKPVTASSTENAGLGAGNAVDGNAGTRWSSAFADPQWLRVDLGGTATIDQVTLNWEAAYARSFQLQVSADGTTWTTVYSTTTGAGGVQTLAVTGTGRYVRMLGTQRGTPYGYSLWEFQVFGTLGTTNPPPSGFWGDTASIPAAQNVVMVKILNRTNGRYPDSQVYWTFNGQTRSIAQQQYLDMPANSAGRMYFHLGSPTSAYYDFIEFTVGANVFNGNTTRVDAFGLKLAMRLRADDGYDVQVGENQATFAETREATFQRFRDAVPNEFDVLAADPTRIITPNAHPSFRPGGVNAGYFTGYSGGIPTMDVFGCSGVLANDPVRCAALNRHVVGLSAADQQNPARFYQAAPANWYAKFWHDVSIGGLAYGFPYDDYANQSSFVSRGDPTYLLVAVGW